MQVIKDSSQLKMCAHPPSRHHLRRVTSPSEPSPVNTVLIGIPASQSGIPILNFFLIISLSCCFLKIAYESITWLFVNFKNDFNAIYIFCGHLYFRLKLCF